MDDQDYYNLICSVLSLDYKIRIENVSIATGEFGVDRICVEILMDNEHYVLPISREMEEIGFRFVDFWSEGTSVFIGFEYG